MLSVDKMTVLVTIFSKLIMCQIIWGDISVIEMRFSPPSPPGARSCQETAEFTLGDTPELISKDISLKTNKTKYFP